MSIPDGLPTLAAFSHHPGHGKACVMEYVSLLAGEPWSDSPSCTNPALARVAREVNDTMSDARRDSLVPLIGRLFGTSEDTPDISLRLAAWSMRYVLNRLVLSEEVSRVYEDAAEAVALCISCPTRETLSNLSERVETAHTVMLGWVFGEDFHSRYARMFSGFLEEIHWLACSINRDSVHHTAMYERFVHACIGDLAHVDESPLAYLSALIDEYDRITGRGEHYQPSEDELSELRRKVDTSAARVA